MTILMKVTSNKSTMTIADKATMTDIMKRKSLAEFDDNHGKMNGNLSMVEQKYYPSVEPVVTNGFSAIVPPIMTNKDVQMEVSNIMLPNAMPIQPLSAQEAFFANLAAMQSQSIQNGVYAGSIQPFQVTWTGLSYIPPKGLFSGGKSGQKIILKDINGHFKSGEMTAVMGPSGCGKSTLLNAIAGLRNDGLSGSISISPSNSQVKFAYIEQDDHFLTRLTILESIMYASKLKNGGRVDHEEVVGNVMDKLRIKECANLYPNRCSGGQKKRISIALELVSRPNILILDEPTSGLDSVTTWQLANTLLELTQQREPVSVVATIHQPSAKVFNLFHSIYILSFDGQCIYHGAPQDLLLKLSKYGLECPKFHNPADFVVEVASKDHGIEKVMMLATSMRVESYEKERVSGSALKFKHKFRMLDHIWLLTIRNLKISIRDPFILPIRLILHVVVCALLSILYGDDSGKLSGCPDEIAKGQEGSYVENFEAETVDINENLACIFFVVMIGWFGSIFPVLLTFPTEMKVLFREYQNGWYNIFCYFLAKVIADIPFQLTIPNLFSVPVYILTGQFDEEWRVMTFAVIFMLVAFNANSSGLMISAIFMEYPSAAAFLGVCTAFPIMLFSGFMIRIDTMPEYFKVISYTNYVRFALEGTISLVYGNDRCELDATAVDDGLTQTKVDWAAIIPPIENKTFTRNGLVSFLSFFSGNSFDSTENESIVMPNYGLEDDDLWYAIMWLVILMVSFRVLTYFTLLWKVKSSG